MPDPVGDQHVEKQWDTPDLDEVGRVTRRHVERMEASDADSVWNWSGMEHLLLTTVGRTSGKLHKVALATWRDPDAQRIVAGSAAGSDRHPAWFLNVRDRTEPEVLCRVQTKQFWSAPDILDGDEYLRIWDLLTRDREFFTEYQAKIARRIPLVRLPETRPA
jgi:deazaflavin-dependent oxidoreductase (nitroreductase family)